jgi:hypothetical protein
MVDPKITINPEVADAAPAPAQTPTAQILAEALREADITFGNGRVMSVRKPSTLVKYRIVAALGAELSANQVYMSMVEPLLWVSKIDGQPVFMPTSELQVEALITQIGDDGMDELTTWYMINVMGPVMQAMDAAKAQAREREQVKN